MAQAESKTAEVAVAPPPYRMDESARDMFRQLGKRFPGLGIEEDEPLPEGLVFVYRQFKQIKDEMSPGPLSAEGYAMVFSLHKLREAMG